MFSVDVCIHELQINSWYLLNTLRVPLIHAPSTLQTTAGTLNMLRVPSIHAADTLQINYWCPWITLRVPFGHVMGTLQKRYGHSPSTFGGGVQARCF